MSLASIAILVFFALVMAALIFKVASIIKKQSGDDESTQEDESGARQKQTWSSLKIYYAVIALISAILFAAEWLTPALHREVESSLLANVNWSWGMTLFVIQCIYLLLSIKIVNPTEKGTLTILGYPLRSEITSGPVLVLLFLCKLHVDTKNLIQVEFGTPEHDKNGVIVKRSELIPGLPVMRIEDPLRITFAARAGKGLVKGDPLNKRLTADPRLLLQYVILHHPTFFQHIGSVDAANRSIIDVAQATLQEAAGKMTPAEAVREMADLNKKLREAVEEWVKDPYSEENEAGSVDLEKLDPGSWGVNILKISVVSPGIPRRVNEAIADAAGAGFEKQKLTELGQGTANAREALLRAEAKGLKAIGDSADSETGRLALQVQTTRDALENADFTIFSGDNPVDAVIGRIAEVTNRSSNRSGPRPNKQKPEAKKQQEKKGDK